MEKPRVRPLWLLLFLLIPLLIFVPLLFRGDAVFSLRRFDISDLQLEIWSGAALLSSVWLVFYGVIIGFFGWLKERIELLSYRWLMTNLAISVIFAAAQHVIWPLVFQKIFRGNSGIFGWAPANTFLINYISSSIATLLLFALLASDLLFHLRKLGVEADSSTLRVLARARDHSAPLGAAMIFAQLAPLFYLASFLFR